MPTFLIGVETENEVDRVALRDVIEDAVTALDEESKVTEAADAEVADEVMASIFDDQLDFEDLPEQPGLILRDISCEEFRVYKVSGGDEYRIENPVGLYYRDGGSTHRVVDSQGVSHCVPFPNEGRTVLRWQNKDLSVPVNF